ncbi:MAG: hypothetical protein WA628_23700 [Terriglobales bacterium]
MISWEGKSCQGMQYYSRDRGSTIMGTTGTVLADRDGYEIYDLKGSKTSEFKSASRESSPNLIGRDSMTDAHFANFIAGIRKGERLNAPVAVGNQCNHAPSFKYRLGSQPGVTPQPEGWTYPGATQRR